MKKRFLILTLALFTLGLNASAYEIIKFHHKSSDKYYPGTERDVEVFIPDSYDGKTPACLYVGLDGILCNAPHVMDSLINAGKMPVTIGVFVQPGVIKDKDGNVLRYNRSNEFDMPTATFSAFLKEEVLPSVEKLTTAKGKLVKLSQRGTDGMIFGLSSGGIAAFAAAWHSSRFSRVFSGVGTFVAMRGGNDLQAIVRKSEPRPLRIFLQDGTNDVWNPLFGHWYEGNRMLASALDFAGYDARYDWSDCEHGVKRANEIFAEVMEWMWKGWPEAPKRGNTQNDLLNTMLAKDYLWGIPGRNIKKIERPAEVKAVYPDGKLIARAHPGTNCLWQYTIDENGDEHNGQPYYWLHNYDNSLLTISAMAFDGAGNLWVVTNAGIQICDQNGRVRGILALPSIDAKRIVEIGFKNYELYLRDEMNTMFFRKLRITHPIEGVTPKSQGQG